MKKVELFFIALLFFTFQTISAQDTESMYFSKTVEGSFEEVTENVKSVLKEQGFGVITEVDMDKTLKEKLDNVTMKPYKILGVCNPSFAYKSLTIEENIGVFLPCKAIVKEIESNKIEVVIVNPAALMALINKEGLDVIAEEVSKKFQTALEKL